jgi:hypothetical protein
MKRSVSAIRDRVLPPSALDSKPAESLKHVDWRTTKIGKVHGGFFADRQVAMDMVRKNQSEMEVEHYSSNDEEEPDDDDDDDDDDESESAAAPRSAFVLDKATRRRLHRALDSLLVGKDSKGHSRAMDAAPATTYRGYVAGLRHYLNSTPAEDCNSETIAALIARLEENL